MKSNLGDRMKAYEACWKGMLPPRMPIIVRLDGRAFHTYTKKLNKPFDSHFIAAMDYAAMELVSEAQGCILAYTQSDEISLVLQTDASENTNAYFGGGIQKIVSSLAAFATMKFNEAAIRLKLPPGATFDARCFVLPWDDVPNYLVWRYRDCVRNAIHMVARSHYSHKELHKKSQGDMIAMMEADGHTVKIDSRTHNGSFKTPHEEVHPHVNMWNVGLRVDYLSIKDAFRIVMEKIRASNI